MAALAHDPLAILTASLLLAAVFARGAWHKLSDLDMFRVILDAYELLPQRLSNAIAPILGGVEGLTALCLLLPPMRFAGAIGAMFLLAAYAVAIAVNLQRGRFDIDCGCGGAGEGLSWLLVARNAGLILLGVVAMLAPSTRNFTLQDWLALPLLVALPWLLVLAVEQVGANNAARRRLINVFQRGA